MFLKVKYYDNDFTIPMKWTLTKLWLWMNENNGHLTEERTILEMFEGLCDSGALKTIIDRLFLLESLSSNVEFSTRGLYWKNVKWEEHKIDEPINYSLSEYLSCDVSIHETDFCDEFSNSECAFMNLNTGKITIY